MLLHRKQEVMGLNWDYLNQICIQRYKISKFCVVFYNFRQLLLQPLRKLSPVSKSLACNEILLHDGTESTTPPRVAVGGVTRPPGAIVTFSRR